jgi:MYXO-CTERM domain-containing protein
MSPGVPAGDDKQHLSVLFAGAPKSATLAEPIQSPWIAAAAQALKGSALLRDAGPEVAGDSLRIGEHAGAMVIEASVPASALSAAALIRAGILAVRPSAIADPEAEVATTPDEELAQWRRDAAPVALQSRPGADDSDARWFWVLALALLGVEAVVRRRRVRIVEGEAHADAA